MKRVKHDVRDLTDETLALAKTGNKAALAEVFRASKGIVAFWANKQRVDDATKEDLQSIAQFGVLNALRTYKPNKGKFLAWMTQWVKAKLWVESRKRNLRAQRTTEFALQHIEAPLDAEQQLVTEAQRTELHQAISKLPSKLRAVMRGRLEGKTLADIGRETDYSRERVRQLEAMALVKLRETMEAA